MASASAVARLEHARGGQSAYRHSGPSETTEIRAKTIDRRVKAHRSGHDVLPWRDLWRRQTAGNIGPFTPNEGAENPA
jgi:hypothetical protein